MSLKFNMSNIDIIYSASNDRTKLCVAIYAYGSYEGYIPIYVYSLLLAYPSYSCIVFLDGELSGELNKSFKDLTDKFADNFKYYILDDKTKKVCSLLQKYKCKPGLRWLLPSEEFIGYDYVYVGDVDFIITPEEPPLAIQHIQHMREEGLDYSNLNRGNSRLSGLHFYKQGTFTFEITDDFLNEIEEWLRSYKKKVGIDEFLLYKLIEKKTKIIDVKSNFRPGHGFHFAACRKSYLEFVFNDFRHNKIDRRNGWYGQNLYSRKKIVKYSREILFSDKVFMNLYSRHINVPLSRFRLLVMWRSVYFIIDMVMLLVSFPKTLFGRVVSMLKARLK